MKKNITINMQGRLYAIDEDAYDLLKQYEDSLRGYFASKDGGNEIVDDIESRIAELFDEVKANGKVAIDIDDVQRIIKQIGNPQQMEEEAQEGPSEDAETLHGTDANGNDDSGRYDSDDSFWTKLKNLFVRKGHRLYRDTKDKKILGVISGLAHYYGGDVTIWRIVVCVIGIVLLFSPFNTDDYAAYMLIAYFVLGMVIPKAETPEERLQMNGKDVNPQNIAEEVTSESNATATAKAPNSNQQQGCLSTFGEMLMAFIKIVMYVVFGSIVIGFISLLIFFILMLFAPSLEVFTDSGIIYTWSQHPWVGTIGLLSFIMLIVLIVYGFITRKTRQSTTIRMIFFILLLAALTGTLTCATIVTSDIKKQIEKYDDQLARNYKDKHTHNGTYMEDTDWNYLRSGGWKIINNKDCNDHYTASGEFYTGNDERQYLDSYNEGGQQLYRVERTDSTLTPGTYSLTATVRSDGTGAYIYAIADGKTYKMEIPAEGNTGGGIWQDAKAEVGNNPDDDTATGKQKLLQEIADANGGNGYGWSRITINGIKSRSGKIRYGVTTVPSITNDQFAGTWLSADEFKLSKQ